MALPVSQICVGRLEMVFELPFLSLREGVRDGSVALELLDRVFDLFDLLRVQRRELREIHILPPQLPRINEHILPHLHHMLHLLHLLQFRPGYINHSLRLPEHPPQPQQPPREHYNQYTTQHQMEWFNFFKLDWMTWLNTSLFLSTSSPTFLKFLYSFLLFTFICFSSLWTFLLKCPMEAVACWATRSFFQTSVLFVRSWFTLILDFYSILCFLLGLTLVGLSDWGWGLGEGFSSYFFTICCRVLLLFREERVGIQQFLLMTSTKSKQKENYFNIQIELPGRRQNGVMEMSDSLSGWNSVSAVGSVAHRYKLQQDQMNRMSKNERKVPLLPGTTREKKKIELPRISSTLEQGRVLKPIKYQFQSRYQRARTQQYSHIQNIQHAIRRVSLNKNREGFLSFLKTIQNEEKSKEKGMKPKRMRIVCSHLKAGNNYISLPKEVATKLLKQ